MASSAVVSKLSQQFRYHVALWQGRKMQPGESSALTLGRLQPETPDVVSPWPSGSRIEALSDHRPSETRHEFDSHRIATQGAASLGTHQPVIQAAGSSGTFQFAILDVARGGNHYLIPQDEAEV